VSGIDGFANWNRAWYRLNGHWYHSITAGTPLAPAQFFRRRRD